MLFAGYCWQIIRTTDTGGVKLLYNGVATNNKCDTITKKTGIIGGNGQTNVTGLNTTTTYGTGFTYTASGFTLTGVMTGKTWSSGYSELLGTYTCKGTNETCTTIYYIGRYKDTSSAYGASYTLGEVTDQYTIGKSAFNGYYDSPSAVGYMYNKIYVGTSGAKSGDYGASIDNYNYTNGIYTLSDTEAGTAPTVERRYVCDEDCSKVRYYYSNDYYILLENGEDVNDALYNMVNYKTTEDITNEKVDANINVHNSAIKAYLDSWYQTNLTSYESFIDTSAVYCNDRSISDLGSWNPTSSSIASDLKFKQSLGSKNNDLRCENKTDRFSTENTSARLTKAIGLLTEPERRLMGSAYAGGTVNTYWIISPYYFATTAYVNSYATSGSLRNYYVYYAYGVRPVVTLSADARITEGDGKAGTPFVIGPKVERTIS